MDVRCERCRAQYVFDDEQVTPSGLTVQCTNCGHVFKVKKKELVVTVPVKIEELEGSPIPATAAAPRPGGQASAAAHELERSREWRVRQANGNVFTFRELTTLQKWIVEMKVSRDDEISLAGDQWKRLGNIAELASFFQVVEAAERGKSQGAAPAVTPLPMPAVPVYGVAIQTPGFYPPAPSGFPPPSFTLTPAPPTPIPPTPAHLEPRYAPSLAEPPEAEIDVDMKLAPPRRSVGRRWTIALLALAALGTGAYLVIPALLPAKSPDPESLAVPLDIQLKPEASAGTAGMQVGEPQVQLAPAVPAPQPVAEQPIRQPEPLEKVAPKAAPAPKGPKALLAEADRARQKGHPEKALDLYARVVDDDPQNADALAGRGLCYLDLSSYPPAQASFEAALQIDPEHPDALLGLAESYRWQEKKADAIKYYEKYLAAHPGGEEADVARNALDELRK